MTDRLEIDLSAVFRSPFRVLDSSGSEWIVTVDRRRLPKSKLYTRRRSAREDLSRGGWRVSSSKLQPIVYRTVTMRSCVPIPKRSFLLAVAGMNRHAINDAP